MKSRKFVLPAFFLLVGITGQAQKAWTLKECIDYALRNNIQIKQNQLNADLSRVKLEQSVASMFPNLNGSASHSYNYGRTIDPFTNQFVDQRTQYNNFSLNSSISLFEGFQVQNTLRQSNYDYKAGKLDVQKSQNDIALSVVTAYLQILYNKELVNISKSQLEVSENQVSRTRKLVETGSLPKGSLLDAEAQAASEELRLINAQNQLELSYLNLTQLLDLPTPKGFDIIDPQLSLPTTSLAENTPESVFEYAVKNQPEIKSAELKVRSAEKGLSIARGARYPRLSLGGSMGTGYSDIRTRVTGFTTITYISGITQGSQDPVISSQRIPLTEKTPFRDQLEDNINKSIGLTLSIPILNNWQVQSSVARAKINRANAELNNQLAINQLNKTIQQAHADANAALKKYNATAKTLESLREAFKYTEQKFNVGLVNSIDYMNAKNNQSKAESDLLQAKYDFIFKSKVLDFYLGKPLIF
jgi:outer membrane protein